jgi:hypothetical protein
LRKQKHRKLWVVVSAKTGKPIPEAGCAPYDGTIHQAMEEVLLTLGHWSYREWAMQELTPELEQALNEMAREAGLKES